MGSPAENHTRISRFPREDCPSNLFVPMGQQLNKIQKRKRRAAYNVRKKEAAKAASSKSKSKK